MSIAASPYGELRLSRPRGAAPTPTTTAPRVRASVSRTRVATGFAVATAVAVAAGSGLSAGNGSKLALVLPVVAATAAGLGLLALTRFSGYVMAMLVLRASVDLAKISGGGVGTTTATHTAAQRAVDPSSIFAVMFILAGGLWIAAQHRHQGSLPGSTLRRTMLAFVAAAILSVFGSANPGSSSLEALRILAVAIMFVVLEQMMTNPAQMRRLLFAVYASAIFPLLFTLAGFLVGHPRAEQKGAFTRITGTFHQSNTFGRYLMLMIVFGVAMYPYLGKRYRIPLALALAPATAFLLFTYTRTALIGAFLGLLVVGFIQSKRLLVGLALVVMVSLIAVPQLASRLGAAASVTSASTTDHTGNSLAWRLAYWTEVIPLANSNPVTGIGLNMTQYNTDQAKQPHSDVVRAYVETGLIGFGAYLALLFSMLSLGRRAVRRTLPGTFDRGVAVGFLGCAVAFVAASTMANVVSGVVNLWYLFAFAAAASAIVRRTPAPVPVGDRAAEPLHEPVPQAVAATGAAGPRPQLALR